MELESSETEEVIARSGGCRNNSSKLFRISVKKSKEVTSPCCAGGSTESIYIPPALPANQPSFDKWTSGVAVSVGTTSQGNVNSFFRTKVTGHDETAEKNCKVQQRISSSNHDCEAARLFSPEPAEGSRQEGSDVLISQYAVGQKEATKAIIKRKKFQSGPVGKTVKVQFLGNPVTEKKEHGPQDTKETLCNLGPATSAAAAAAAAIAATAPLLKAQSDLETKIVSVAEVVSKLQEMYQQVRQQVAEQKEKNPGQQPESDKQRERVRELEMQLNKLLEQRLCHLEKLQQQQLELQSQLMTSAYTANKIHPFGAPQACSDIVSQSSATYGTAAQTLNLGLQQLPSNNLYYVSLKDMPSDSSAAALANGRQPATSRFRMENSPLQTPAPRRYAPVPMSKDGKVQQKKGTSIQKAKENEMTTRVGHGNGNFLEEILNNQEKTDTGEIGVVMATGGRHPERSSSGNLLTESFPAFVAPSRGSRAAASPAVQKATDVLHDLGKLKNEMHGILQEAEHWQSRMQGIKKNASANQSINHKTIDSPPLQHHLPKRSSSSSKLVNPSPAQKPSLLQAAKAPASMFEDAERILRVVQSNKKCLEENLQSIVRGKDSSLKYTLVDTLAANSDAAERLRIRKSVDAWIAVISHDIQGEITQKNFLQEITSEEKEHKQVCMKKGCDVKDIKFKKDGKDKAQTKLAWITKKPLSTARPLQKSLSEPYGKRNPRSKPATQQREQKSKLIADPDAICSPEPMLQGEDYLKRVYGKALYQGHRSTSKKGPYLRYNSPAPKAKPQRPKMVENTKGVKVKSARTQTNPFPLKTVVSSPTIQRPFSAPLLPSNQYLFSPSNEMASSLAISGPVEGHLLPMAIPLGEPRIDAGILQPARLLISGAQAVTVTTSIPPKPQLWVRKPNVAVVHVKSEKSLPKLHVQVLPNVDIDSLPSDSPSALHRSPSPEQNRLSPQPTQSLIKLPEVIHSAEVEEEPGFPGISFIAVTDVVEDQHNEDALPEPSEPGIELEGLAGSFSLAYHGTPFPPSAPALQPVVDIVDGMIQHKESVENQLVEWVEQELMSRIISEMYPSQPVPVPHVSNRDESEESVDSASDIVEAAGGSGFQLFVDAGVPVDSGLVRQFVNEALAEIVAIMLGQRESQSTAPVLEPAAGQTPPPEVLVPTPLPTPRHTPSPPARDSPTIHTPELTPQGSESEEKDPESETRLKSLLELSPAESPAQVSPVGTPAVTPVPTPSRVSTPSPVTTKDASLVPTSELPNPWGDAELPLEEENPNSSQETSLQPRAICLSVAKDEEPETLFLPFGLLVAPPEKSPSPPPQVRTPPPSTEESSSTVSTETADRNISEGEVLISYGQIAAAKAFLEGGLPLPHINESLSSTLRDAQEMDEDSPSEGQVIRASHRGGEKYSLGTLLAGMNRGAFAPQEIYHPENSDDDNSAGQISEGQMPRLTVAAESILTGHSQYMNPFAANRHSTSIQRRNRSASPGQLDSQTGRSERLSEASYGPMSLAELEGHTVPAPRSRQVIVAPQKTAARGQGDEVAQTEQRPVITHLLEVQPANSSRLQPSTQGDMDQMRIEPNIYLGSQFPGTEAEISQQSNLQAPPLKMSVTLPSMNEEDQCDSISTIDGDDTSGADIF